MLLLAQRGERTPQKYSEQACHFAAGPKAFAGGFGHLSPEPLGMRVTLSAQAGCG